MEYLIDNLPLLAIAVLIIFVQSMVFRSTLKKISVLKMTLIDSDQFHMSEMQDEDCDLTTTQIYLQASNDITQIIEDSINQYLKNNKGAVSDFHLIKDIVERNCDSKSAEIDAQVSMPLYLGLIGTVAGIVLGLGSLALQGVNLGDSANIIALMVGVAFAMIASGMGVVFTSICIWKNKKCRATLEDNKNSFYTWIQTVLLPVLSSSTTSTLSLLERNLTTFNYSFGKIVNRLDKKLSEVGDLYESQIELLDRIERIDVVKMATANVKILETLTTSSERLKDFAQYMDNTTQYLTAVKTLNDKIDEHLERTKALEAVADFYKNQLGDVMLRQNAVKSVVTDVDEVVKKALADLAEHTETGLQGLRNIYTDQNETMKVIANEEGNALRAAIKKLDAVINVTSELQHLPGIVSQLSKNAFEQAKATTKLAKAVEKLQYNNGRNNSTNNSRLVSWIKKAFHSTTRWIKDLFGKNDDGTTQPENRFSSSNRGKKHSEPYRPLKIDHV